jgi:hypothetical protein
MDQSEEKGKMAMPDPIPSLLEADYLWFRDQIPELPPKYSRWASTHDLVVASLEKRTPNRSVNRTISPAEFRSYLQVSGKPASVHDLWQCAKNLAANDKPPANAAV